MGERFKLIAAQRPKAKRIEMLQGYGEIRGGALTYVPKVFRYLRPYLPVALGFVALTFVGSAIGLLSPWPMKFLVDSVLGSVPLTPSQARWLGSASRDKAALLLVVVLSGLTITVANHLLGALRGYVRTRMELGVTLDFRCDLFQHLQRLSMTVHDQRRSGMLMYVVTSMASTPTTLVTTFISLAQSVITLGGMFWITYLIDPLMAVLSLTAVPFLYFAVGYYLTHIRERLIQVKSMEGETISLIHEALAMFRVIVAFGREDYEQRRVRSQGERAIDARIKLTVRQSLFELGVHSTTATGAALVLGLGGYRALQGQLSVGELLVVLSYVGSIYKPLEAISSIVGSLQDQLINLQIAFSTLDSQQQMRDEPGAVAIRRAAGHVTFENLQFSYQGRSDTLKNISFDVAPGQVVALVGPTGAGKTTMMSLLPRFYDPAGGRILLDGLDTKGITLKSLRQQISIVLQEPLLFSTSIADNIRYGRLDATDADVEEAARMANAHDFIVRLPQQYATEIGERGAKLSIGERQRISIARAFLKGAPVLILDEPTSACDSKTEGVILEALDRLMTGRTTFMVAHRLSTIHHADMILVINRGEIVERGTHEELLVMGGLYRQLHDAQTGKVRRRLQAELLSAVGEAKA